jgi:purine-cytosine permease-like protein
MSGLQTWLASLAAWAAAHNPGVPVWLWAAIVAAAGFAAASLGGRLIGLVVRFGIAALGVLVAAKMAGMMP